MVKKTSKSKSDVKTEVPVAPVEQAPQEENAESSMEDSFKNIYEKINGFINLSLYRISYIISLESYHIIIYIKIFSYT